MFFHDIKKMSLNGLKAMQKAIHDLLVEEDGLPAGAQKDYGVRQHWDWKAQGDEIEAELTSRGEQFASIPW